MLIVIEGLDGAGKSTQVNLLQQYFQKQQKLSQFLHFPRYHAEVYGELISAFLRGEFGDAKSVDPKLVALLYAGDRHNAASEIKNWLAQGQVVVLDRYVYSNIAFQCAKEPDLLKREQLRQWIFDLEYRYFDIPKPDLNIFLDVPFGFTTKQLKLDRSDADRSYLKGKNDIHEADIKLQQEVRSVYLNQAEHDKQFKVIACANSSQQMAAPEDIHQLILTELHAVNFPK